MIKTTIFGTPLHIKPIVLIDLAGLWAIAAWLEHLWHPGWGLGLLTAVGFGAMLLMILADFGHATAHIFSARRAGGPMSELYISAGMPRTLYSDNDVAPAVHMGRSLGGPIYSAVGFLLSLLVQQLATPGSVIGDLAAWSLIGQGFILLGCLMPLPMVDGGVLLKWALVRQGRTEAEADQVVKRSGWVAGVVLALAVLVVIAFWRGWLG